MILYPDNMTPAPIAFQLLNLFSYDEDIIERATIELQRSGILTKCKNKIKKIKSHHLYPGRSMSLSEKYN